MGSAWKKIAQTGCYCRQAEMSRRPRAWEKQSKCVGTLDQESLILFLTILQSTKYSTLSLTDAVDSVKIGISLLKEDKRMFQSVASYNEGVQQCSASLYIKSNHTKAAVIGARAAWSLNEWGLMDTPGRAGYRRLLHACSACWHKDFEKSRST